MKDIILKGKTYQIPQNWDDITLSSYLNLKKLEKRKIEMESEDFYAYVIEALTDIPYDVILELEIATFLALVNELLQVTKSDFEEAKTDFIKLKGRYFAMDRNDLGYHVGMLSDFDGFLREGDVWENMSKIAGGLLREVSNSNTLVFKFKERFNKLQMKDFKIKKYQAEDCLANAEFFVKNLPMSYIYSISNFFLTSREDYLNNIQTYIQAQQTLMQEKKK
jgi:hypothetical protein